MSFSFQINSLLPVLSPCSQCLPFYYNYHNFNPLITDCCPSFPFYSNLWDNSQFKTQRDINTLLASSEPILASEILNNSPVSSTNKKKSKIQKYFQKTILSAKKNGESNIINQFYSFFGSRQKSEAIVKRCLSIMEKSQSESEPMLAYFYQIIHFINVKRVRKYVNVASFLKLFTGQELTQELIEMKSQVEHNFLDMEQLSEIIRRCAKHFLKEISIQAILTSKRINLISKKEHLRKHRKVLKRTLGY